MAGIKDGVPLSEVDQLEAMLQDLKKQRGALIKAAHVKTLTPHERRLHKRCEDSLMEFVRAGWHILEPMQPFVDGWAIRAVAQHLEAMVDGRIQKLLINVPPGFMKSLLTKVFFPAWCWGPKGLSHLRFVTASYAYGLSERDAGKMLTLINSEWYQKLWPHVQLDKEREADFSTTDTGGMFGTSVSGQGTGHRGDFFLADDPNSVKEAESKAVREETNRWYKEVVPTRVNNPLSSGFILIQQRVHEDDVTGFVLRDKYDYEKLILPMEFDPTRRCKTSIGFVDPRTYDKELLWPERFPKIYVDAEIKRLGPYAAAAQFDQDPRPRGGGIIQLEDWKTWESAEFPAMDYIIASLDPAYTEKDENDYSGFTIWGVFRDPKTRQPQAMLMYAWHERLQLHKLVQKVGKDSRRFRVDQILIEDKASGHSVAQELQRLFAADFGVRLVTPRGDKVARAYSVQHLWTQGFMWSPDRAWASLVKEELSSLPKGRHDDLADSATQAARYMRSQNWLLTQDEGTGEENPLFGKALQESTEPIYDC